MHEILYGLIYLHKTSDEILKFIRHEKSINILERMECMQNWDVFISHASEDKDEVARPLTQLLYLRNYTVWYDEFTLKIGDSLTECIDRGLANSRYGIVILSDNFFKKRWPQRELQGLVSKDIQYGNVILPIWHKIDKKTILEFSPPLADKLGVSTDKGLEHVVDKIAEVIKKDSIESNAFFRAEYLLRQNYGREAIISLSAYLEDFLKKKAIENLTYSYFKNKPIHSYRLIPLIRLLIDKRIITTRNYDYYVDYDRIVSTRNKASHCNEVFDSVQVCWFIAEVKKFIEMNKNTK